MSSSTVHALPVVWRSLRSAQRARPLGSIFTELKPTLKSFPSSCLSGRAARRPTIAIVDTRAVDVVRQYSSTGQGGAPDPPRQSVTADGHSNIGEVEVGGHAAPAAPLPSPPAASKRRVRRGYIYGGIFLLLGLSMGRMLTLLMDPPDSVEPGSQEDTMRTNYIRQKASKLALVQELDADPRYTSWDAYPTLESAADAGKSRLTSGALAGSRGIGAYQRVWHDAVTGECISVIFLGDAISGWPYIVHGGLLATLLDESLGRTALLKFPGKTGVTANLNLSYVNPTTTNAFYVIRTKLLDEGASAHKQWVEGTLETIKGIACVKAKALFVVPKGYKLGPVQVGL